MQTGFARALWESFKSALNAVIAVVALVLSLAVWFLAPEAKVSLGLVVPIGTLVLVVLLTAVLTLIDAALQSHDRAHQAEESRDKVQEQYDSYKAVSGLPKVVEGREPFASLDAELVCFLEPSDRFSSEIMVSFFSVNEQDHEEPIGVGVVLNIQENGIIQAAMESTFPGHEDFADRLRRNEGAAVRTTRVKPNVPRGYASFRSTRSST